MRTRGVRRSGTGLRAAARTDPGLVRRRNEDACVADTAAGLFAVADGIAGQPAGDVAARLAVSSLPAVVARAVREHGRDRLGAALVRAVADVDELVAAAAASRPELAGMGTTLVLLLCTGSVAHVVHAGDSRAYLLRQDHLHRLTEDHCLAADLVRAGALEPEAAHAHPLARCLTRAVGLPGAAGPDVRRLDLAHGDRLLLCSDGLTTMLSEQRVAALLSVGDPDRACRALVDAANAAGGRDNVSAVVVHVRHGPRRWIGRDLRFGRRR